MALDPIANLIGSTVTEAQEKVWFTNLRTWLVRSLGGDTLAAGAALGKIIYGLTYSNNGGDPTNDLNILPGGAMDATGAYFMALGGGGLTKQSDAAWAVGSAAGALDTGAVGNSDYYIWLIARSDTGVVDALFSLSSTAPTMPTNYDFKRLVGWFKRVGGTIVAMHVYETEGGGIELSWDVPTLDINITGGTLSTARRTDAVKVPLNFSTIARVNIHLDDAGGAVVDVCSPDQTDAAPSASVAPLSSDLVNAATNDNRQLRIRTSATGTIAARATAAVDNYLGVTLGFTWARRN